MNSLQALIIFLLLSLAERVVADVTFPFRYISIKNADGIPTYASGRYNITQLLENTKTTLRTGVRNFLIDDSFDINFTLHWLGSGDFFSCFFATTSDITSLGRTPGGFGLHWDMHEEKAYFSTPMGDYIEVPQFYKGEGDYDMSIKFTNEADNTFEMTMGDATYNYSLASNMDEWLGNYGVFHGFFSSTTSSTNNFGVSNYVITAHNNGTDTLYIADDVVADEIFSFSYQTKSDAFKVVGSDFVNKDVTVVESTLSNLVRSMTNQIFFAPSSANEEIKMYFGDSYRRNFNFSFEFNYIREYSSDFDIYLEALDSNNVTKYRTNILNDAQSCSYYDGTSLQSGSSTSFTFSPGVTYKVDVTRDLTVANEGKGDLKLYINGVENSACTLEKSLDETLYGFRISSAEASIVLRNLQLTVSDADNDLTSSMDYFVLQGTDKVPGYSASARKYSIQNGNPQFRAVVKSDPRDFVLDNYFKIEFTLVWGKTADFFSYYFAANSDMVVTSRSPGGFAINWDMKQAKVFLSTPKGTYIRLNSFYKGVGTYEMSIQFNKSPTNTLILKMGNSVEYIDIDYVDEWIDSHGTVYGFYSNCGTIANGFNVIDYQIRSTTDSVDVLYLASGMESGDLITNKPTSGEIFTVTGSADFDTSITYVNDTRRGIVDYSLPDYLIYTPQGASDTARLYTTDVYQRDFNFTFDFNFIRGHWATMEIDLMVVTSDDSSIFKSTVLPSEMKFSAADESNSTITDNKSYAFSEGVYYTIQISRTYVDVTNGISEVTVKRNGVVTSSYNISMDSTYSNFVMKLLQSESGIALTNINLEVSERRPIIVEEYETVVVQSVISYDITSDIYSSATVTETPLGTLTVATTETAVEDTTEFETEVSTVGETTEVTETATSTSIETFQTTKTESETSTFSVIVVTETDVETEVVPTETTVTDVIHSSATVTETPLGTLTVATTETTVEDTTTYETEVSTVSESTEVTDTEVSTSVESFYTTETQSETSTFDVIITTETGVSTEVVPTQTTVTDVILSTSILTVYSTTINTIIAPTGASVTVSETSYQTDIHQVTQTQQVTDNLLSTQTQILATTATNIIFTTETVYSNGTVAAGASSGKKVPVAAISGGVLGAVAAVALLGAAAYRMAPTLQTQSFNETTMNDVSLNNPLYVNPIKTVENDIYSPDYEDF